MVRWHKLAYVRLKGKLCSCCDEAVTVVREDKAQVGCERMFDQIVASGIFSMMYMFFVRNTLPKAISSRCPSMSSRRALVEQIALYHVVDRHVFCIMRKERLNALRT